MLRKQMATGALWMVAVKMVDRGIGLCSTIVLARLLVPADFGLVAMATSILALLELISAFGFDVALIRQPSIERSHYDTAWTMNCVLGIAMAIGLVLLSHPAAYYYDDARVADVALVLALAPFAAAFENIGIVNFRRDMNFRSEFIFQTTRRTLSVLIALPLAFMFRNYWALVLGSVASRFIGTGLSYIVHPYRPRFSLARSAELMAFSQWILLGTSLQYLLSRGSDFVIGKLSGSHALGTYNMSFEVASLPATELVAPINRAVYPAYAQIASDRAGLAREYVAIMGVIASLAVPAAVGLAAVAEVTVKLAFGPKWLEAIPLLQLLALAGAIQVLRTNTYSVYLAIGAPRYQVVINAVHVAVLGALMLLLVGRYGAVGAALAYLGAVAIMVSIDISLVCRVLGIRRREVLAATWRPTLAAAAMYVPVSFVHNSLASLTDNLALGAELALLIAIGVTSYAAMVALLWRLSGAPDSAERILLNRAKGVLRGMGLWLRTRTAPTHDGMK